MVENLYGCNIEFVKSKLQSNNNTYYNKRTLIKTNQVSNNFGNNLVNMNMNAANRALYSSNNNSGIAAQNPSLVGTHNSTRQTSNPNMIFKIDSSYKNLLNKTYIAKDKTTA